MRKLIQIISLGLPMFTITPSFANTIYCPKTIICAQSQCWWLFVPGASLIRDLLAGNLPGILYFSYVNSTTESVGPNPNGFTACFYKDEIGVQWVTIFVRPGLKKDLSVPNKWNGADFGCGAVKVPPYHGDPTECPLKT